MKKLSTLLTTALMLAATTAFAQGPWNVGSYWGASNVIATFSNGTLTFTGEGKMTNFDAQTTAYCSPWYNIREQITSVVIDKRITTIGDDAFNGCINLTGSLPLHEGITYIGIGAFKDCSQLTGPLAIPQSVTKIKGRAFENCSGLTGDLIIPEEVTDLGEFNAFSGCSGLTGPLTLLGKITEIGRYAFAYCSGLTGSLVIPEGVTRIGEKAFFGCSGLTGPLTIPQGVTRIDSYAFEDCSGLNGSLTIPESLITFGLGIFWDCGFTSVNSYATTPPKITTDVFTGLKLSNITLNVPPSSIALYQEADVWKDFNIAGSLTSVADIQAGDALVVAYYSIHGIKLPREPQSGSYIVVYDNGKTEMRIKVKRSAAIAL
jgi:hypothetical protein